MKKQLKSIIDREPNSLRAFVATEILDSEEPNAYLQDLSKYGCISGMVSSLTYYSDTHDFYDRFYPEIEYLRLEFEDSI